MTNQDVLDFVLSKKSCQEGRDWLTNLIKEKPEITPEEIWNECLNMQSEHPKTKKMGPARYWFALNANDTSVGRAFCSWVCLQLEIPCSTGIYSGVEKISSGPPVGKIPFESILAALESKK